MNRDPRILTTEEMVVAMSLGQLLLDWKAFRPRYVMGMEVPNG